jgi:hypothetical protein
MAGFRGWSQAVVAGLEDGVGEVGPGPDRRRPGAATSGGDRREDVGLEIAPVSDPVQRVGQDEEARGGGWVDQRFPSSSDQRLAEVAVIRLCDRLARLRALPVRCSPGGYRGGVRGFGGKRGGKGGVRGLSADVPGMSADILLSYTITLTRIAWAAEDLEVVVDRLSALGNWMDVVDRQVVDGSTVLAGVSVALHDSQAHIVRDLVAATITVEPCPRRDTGAALFVGGLNVGEYVENSR